jgi:hypothetical protein
MINVFIIHIVTCMNCNTRSSIYPYKTPALTRFTDVIILGLQILKFNKNVKVIKMLKEFQNLVNERL